MKKQVKLSPNILWVDNIIMGSTIGRYVLRIWDENLSLVICVVDGKTNITRSTLGRWEENDENPSPNLVLGMLRFISAPICKKIWIFISSPIWKGGLRFISYPIYMGGCCAWEGGLRYWIKSSVQGTTIRKISFLSYAMIGDYTLEPLTYVVHNRGVWLVDIV